MDLLATVRKEGSRGGRSDFKWSDVQSSSHRENYLGHSLMAPVGRWQKGKDLNWYAKGDAGEDDGDAAIRAANERKEELRKIKEAEQDAMARALGLPVPDRSNANLQEMSNKRDFDKALKEAIGNDTEEGGKGVGFGGAAGAVNSDVLGERIEGNAEAQDKELQYALKEYNRRHGDHKRTRHHRSRSGDRERRHHRRDRSRERRRDDRYEDSSKTRERHRKRRSRSRSRDRYREDGRQGGEKRRERSRSPRKRDEVRSERRKRFD